MNDQNYTVWLDDYAKELEPMPMTDDGDLKMSSSAARCLRCNHELRGKTGDLIMARYCPCCGAQAVRVKKATFPPPEPLLNWSPEEALEYMHQFVNAFRKPHAEVTDVERT